MKRDYRDEFPVTNAWAFLNHANVGPLSRRAVERLAIWIDDVAMNGDTSIGSWLEEIEHVRAAAARLVGARTHEIAFLKNTSEGISLIAEGFPWKARDNVVVAAGEYPANLYPWMHLRRKEVDVVTVQASGQGITVDDIAHAMNSQTRLVSISFVQFDTGYRADLAAIGDLCRSRGVDFLVDAIQGIGVFPVDTKSMGIHYLCANSHKWLVSPQGAAVLFVDESNLEKIQPTSVGWKSVVHPYEYSRVDFRFAEDARRFECGSFVVPSIISLGGSLGLFEEIGISTITDRVKSVTDYLVDQLNSNGANVVSCRDIDHWSGIVSFDCPGKNSVEITKHCYDAGVVISSRAGHLRASPHFYNNRLDIDRLIEALNVR